MATVSEDDRDGRLHRSMKERIRKAIIASYGKYLHYGMVLSLTAIVLSILILSNISFHFLPSDIISAHTEDIVFGPFYVLGYTGFFILTMFSPLPDYIIVPFYGYLASIGLFNPYILFVISVLAMTLLMQMEFFAGKYGGRPLLLKVLKYFGVKEREMAVAERWIDRHGTFSVFVFTFIPYVKTAMALTSGLLKMRSLNYLFANLTGFAIRFAILIYVGYNGIDIIADLVNPKYDFISYTALGVAAAYVAFYFVYVRKRIAGRSLQQPQA
jgi:membrane protein DedA with SNARE-associated domain